ncbi:hypothetical protein JCM10213v2_009187 [Rhodosporidiobolus nylandii]
MHLARPQPVRPAAAAVVREVATESSEVRESLSSGGGSMEGVEHGKIGQGRTEHHKAGSASPHPSSNTPPTSLPPPPMQPRRTFSAPVASRPMASFASAGGGGGGGGGGEGGGKSGEAVLLDPFAWDEFRSILSAPSSSSPSYPASIPLPSSSGGSTCSGGTALAESGSNSNSHSTSSGTTVLLGLGSSSFLPPRTPSRAAGTRSRNGGGHQRRRSSAGGGSQGSGGEASSRDGVLAGAGAWATGAGAGVAQRVNCRTPSRVMGWDGEMYSPPSRALTRNPLASALISPSRLSLGLNLGRLHAHSAYPVLEHPAVAAMGVGVGGQEQHEHQEEEEGAGVPTLRSLEHSLAGGAGGGGLGE